MASIVRASSPPTKWVTSHLFLVSIFLFSLSHICGIFTLSLIKLLNYYFEVHVRDHVFIVSVAFGGAVRQTLAGCTFCASGSRSGRVAGTWSSSTDHQTCRRSSNTENAPTAAQGLHPPHHQPPRPSLVLIRRRRLTAEVRGPQTCGTRLCPTTRR